MEIPRKRGGDPRPDVGAEVGRADAVLLAGDIGYTREGSASTLDYAAAVAAQLTCPVVLVPGNHEMYRGYFVDDRASLLAASRPSVHVLDREAAVLPLRCGRMLRVLGATLWTDYALGGDRAAAMATARQQMTDHEVVRWSRGTSRLFDPSDAVAEHRRSRA